MVTLAGGGCFCAMHIWHGFGPFCEEARGFLSPKSIEMLKLGLRNQYGDDRRNGQEGRGKGGQVPAHVR